MRILKKRNTKWDTIAGLIWETPQTIEGLIIAIPYFALNSIGTFIKLIFLSLISILSLNRWIKVDELWSKKFWKTNLGNPWNCVLAIFCIVILSIIF